MDFDKKEKSLIIQITNGFDKKRNQSKVGESFPALTVTTAYQNMIATYQSQLGKR